MGYKRVRKLRIGYWPLSNTLRAAGDRRRLIFWANARGHEIVTDLDQNVDLIVASVNADFHSRHLQNRHVPIVFDLVDAYLSPLNAYEDLGRGLAKGLLGQISGRVRPFSHHVSDFCSLSNAVICSSPEQKLIIESYNPNTHAVLDSHDEIEFVDPVKQHLQRSMSRKLLWEGQPATIRGIGAIYPALFELSLANNLDFDFVTDVNYFQFLNRYFQKSTLKLLEMDLQGLANRAKIIPWSPHNLAKSAESSFAAIIPLDMSVPMQRLKPENRLLIMWRLGLPCLTSPTPAYVRVANQANTRTVCSDTSEWIAIFNQLLEDPDFALSQIVAGQNYVRENHSKSLLLKKWDLAIDSVMG